MRTIAIALSLLAAAFAARAADAPGSASGIFRSQGTTMDVKSAIAYRAKATLDKEDVIVVAITNARMTDAIADYFDRRRALDKRIRDDRTAVVYLEFRPDGRYRGLSYYFASGNGCGYCSGEVMSSVRLADGKLAGSLQGNEKDRSLNVTIDVPVLSDEHGASLGANGGAPGSAYLAYHAALTARDRRKLAPLLSADLTETLADAQKNGKGDGFVDWLLREHPEKSVRIDRAFARGDRAVLVISGQSAAGKLVGEVQLLKQDGRWKVDDELTDLAP